MTDLKVDDPTTTPSGELPRRFTYVSGPHPTDTELVHMNTPEPVRLNEVGEQLMREARAELAEHGLKTAPGMNVTLEVQRGGALLHNQLRFVVEGHAVPDEDNPPPPPPRGALPVLADEDGTVYVLPAVLGWSNGPDRESLRLYGLDGGPSPRWARPQPRVAEQSLREGTTANEGDRMLVIRVGSRFVNDERLQRIAAAVLTTVRTELDKDPS